MRRSRKNITKEEYNAYFCAYRAKNRAKLRKYNRKYNRAWRVKDGYRSDTERKYKWNERNYERYKLISRSLYAYKHGKIKKKPCKCGSKKSVMHHHDMSNHFNVIWMCRVCIKACCG